MQTYLEQLKNRCESCKTFGGMELVYWNEDEHKSVKKCYNCGLEKHHTHPFGSYCNGKLQIYPGMNYKIVYSNARYTAKFMGIHFGKLIAQNITEERKTLKQTQNTIPGLF